MLTFDDLRDHPAPCITCGRLITGSARQPRCRDVATCWHLSQAWRIYYPSKRMPHAQPDSEECE